MGFQKQVYQQQAAAIAGDPASVNPRRSYVAHEGGLVAGSSGVTIGRFAWINFTNNQVSNAGTGVPNGFVPRLQGSALITTYLAESGSLIPTGFEVTLMQGGDWWVQNTVTVAAIGNKVFASLTDGTVQTAAAGATVTGYIETRYFVAGFPIGGSGAVGELICFADTMQ